MAGKGWAWIFTWVVGISQINGDVFKSIGNLNFTCPDGWQFVDSTCYMPVSTIMEFEDATHTCKRYFANLTIIEDEIENKALTDKATSLSWNSFWNGEKITDRCKGYWDVNQPSPTTGPENCAAIFQNGRWKVVSCQSRLPFFCKKPACIDGTFDCGTGRCLSNNWLCDGVNDCGNNLDEMKCKSNCRETQIGVSDRINFLKNAGNTDCTWTLVSPPGSQLVLSFSAIRFYGSDSLEVRIGGQTLGMSSRLDTLSGNHDNQILYSNNNMAVLRFVSDSSNTNSQFQMSWTSNDQNLTTTTISVAAENDWTSLTSPFYPNSPPSGFHKEWLVSSASIVTAKIDNPDLSPDWSLVIYDGEGYDDVIVRADKQSDLVAPSIHMSRHSKIRVVLKGKDTSDGGKGIRIQVKSGCSVDVEATSGMLASPGYLQSVYPSSSTCSWTIHSPPGSTGSFKLKFLELNLHDDGKDKIEIYDSLDATGTSLHPSNGFQGDLMTSLPSVTGTSLYVVFTSSVIQNNGRFKFEFSIDCPAIPDPPNLSKSSNDSSYDSKVEVTCQTGYSFPQEELYQTPALTFTCMKEGNWDRPRFPTCQIVYCGAPPPIEFGYVSNYSGDATYKSTATYTCYDGFTLDGSTEVECQENGNWTSRPSCTSSVCGDPPVVDHASRIRKVGNGTSYGTVIEYECDEGYEILSSPRILCQKNTSWSQPTPTCTEKLCPLPTIENSLPLSETSPVKFGVSVEVSCKMGYVASSTNTTSASLTCKSNQTFDLITCTDKNECDEAPCGSSETCMNTEGSYSCVCKPGYRKSGDETCLDINECAEGSSGCDICINTYGSYICNCSSGFSLFVNGTSGIHIKPGETGDMTGDVYRENHTCVRNQCPRPNDVINGIIHSQKQMFWFEDEITYSCELGYVLEGSTMRTVSRQCQADGSWSGLDPVCQEATCTAQTREGTEAQKDQVHGIYPRTEVQFGDTVIIECKNTDVGTFNKTRFCAYDESTHGYTLQGDSPVCPVVDCGPQENIAGQVEITLNSTVYGSTFEFECETGATTSGFSTSANYTVTCQRNGYWGYGNLTCIAAKCSDPGTLGGTIQKKKSYEQGQIVTYECERPGFEPTPDRTIKCVYHLHNRTATWNNTAPSCQDTTLPTIENGTVQEVWIDRMEAPLMSPVVEDNSGLVVEISPALPGFDVSNPVTDNLTVDYTATDGIGKAQRFQYLIYVRDYTPGTLTCPPHIQLQANTSSTTYNMADYITYSGGGLTSDLHLTTSLDTVGQVTYHRMSLRTEHGTVTTCAFSVEVVASACYHQLTSAPANGRLEPSSGNTGDIFTVAVCNDGFAFSDGATRRNYTCTGQNEWTPAMPMEDCQPYSTSGYSFFVKLDLRTTSRVFVDTPCMTDFNNSYNTSVSTQLENGICRLFGSISEFYRFTVTQINYNLKPPYDNEVELTLRVENSDGSLQSLQACTDQINNVKNVLFKYEFDGCQFTVLPSSLGVNVSRSGESCDPGDALTQVDGSNKCLPCPLGFMYMSSSGQCVQCPSGQYQDEAGRSSCKSCAAGQVSIAPRTSIDHCIDQCRDGFVSTSGSPPCSPCPVDKYWENSTLCSLCPNGGSTLYTQAAANISMCAAPCPTGQYSRTGYEPCRSCPRNFYQEDTGQIMCMECATNETTDNTGSTAASDCKSAGDDNTCLSNCDSTGTDTCQYLYHRAFCTCKQGYTGTRCDSTIDYCLSNPCLNGATCTSDTNGFTCSCQKERVCEMELNSVNFKDANPSFGDRYHDHDDEVNCKSRCVRLEVCVAAVFKEADNNSCSLLTADEDRSAKTGESGTEEAWGRYFDKNCSVKAFFDGDHCERDLRNDCKSNTCSDDGVCRDLVNATECVCSTSGRYTGDNCLRATNLCLTDNCENGGTCTEWGDIRHQCTCLPGYTGDRCQTPIDECALNPEGCLYSGQCVDAVDGYSCNCTQGSGQHCEVITPLCTSDRCQHGLCVHNYQTATAECVCEHPYENNTEGGCSLKDFCASSACVNSERCENSVDGYLCVCLSGYQGSRCQHNTDDCVGNTCEHGRCEDGNDTYTCVCEPGYTGSNCESDIDDCEGQCTNENASGCTDLLQDYVCNCLTGYTGKNCTEEINECDSLPCQHGGMCVDEFSSFRCNCTEGWEGDTCEREIDQCGGVTCQNDADCFNLLHNYFCSCPPGTEGELCGTSPEVCTLLDPCTSRGTCQQLGGAASCNCSANPDYTGLSCELIKDSCKDPDTCKNGGTCVLANPTGHTCTCPPGFSGPTCEVVEDVCDSRCPAGVECVREDKLTFCLCPAQQVLTNTGCQDSSSDFDLFLDAQLSSQPLESALFRLSGNITLMFWVGYFNGKLSVYLSDVTDSEQYLEMYEDQIQFGSVDEGNVTLDPNKNLKTIDGQWDHVAITWSAEGHFVVYINGIQVKEDNLGFGLSSTKLKRIRIDSTFTGYVSQISVWSTILSNSDIASSIINTSFIPVGVRALGWTSGFKMTTGTKRYTPSRAAIGLKLCDSGRIRSESCDGAQDKTAPLFNDCPSEHILTRVSDKRVVERKDVITSPSSGDLPILSTLTDDVLSWGRYDVVFAAKDDAGNYGLCRFKTFITERDTCDVTGFTQQAACGENAIEGFCSSDSLPSVPSPNVLQCSRRGSFNLDKPLEPFVTPVCGVATSQMLRLEVTLTYALLLPCNKFSSISTETDVKAKLVNDIRRKWPALCSDCNNIPIMSTCDGNNVVMTLSFSDLPELLTKSDNTVSLKADEVFLTTVKESDDLDLSSATLQKNDVRVQLSPSCSEAVETDKCVSCGAGTYYNSTTPGCVYCPPGSYTSSPSQTSCTPCSDGRSTLSPGARDSDQCVEKCPAGQYYEEEECKLCPIGFYQHEEGKSFCYPCPPNKITSRTGTDETDKCFDDCPSGTELREDSTCRECTQGFYRTQSIHDKCQPCMGNTTEGPRSKSASDCILPDCGPGHYINDLRECVECEEGSYQSIKWQRQCANCSENFTTENKGSTNSSKCRFVCPAGSELADEGSETCSECPVGRYRDESLEHRFLPCQNCSREFTTAGTGSNNGSDCAIRICYAGSYRNETDNTCSECPVGEYQPEDLKTQCIACPANYTTVGPGSTNQSHCQFFCPDGNEILSAEDETCLECPRGTYHSRGDGLTTRCVNCSTDRTTDTTGAKTDAECKLRVCKAGQFLVNLLGCDDCPLDTYQPEALPRSTTRCLACGTGKGTETPRSISKSDCKPFCEAGQQYNNSSGQCEDCPQGTYNTGSTLTRFKQCAACPDENLTTVGTGSISAGNCTIRNCEAGYRRTSDDKCVACGFGFYQPERAKDTCMTCGPKLNTSSETATQRDDCTVSCGVGEQGQNGTCSSCPEDTYKDMAGYAICSPCTGNFTSDESRTSCTITFCDKGFGKKADDTCEECAKGFYKESRGNLDCTPCPQNFTTESSGATSADDCSKLHCEPGLFDNGTDKCVLCPSGFYKNITGPQECTKCSSDKTTEGEGAINESQCSVALCEAGNYRTSSNVCAKCDKGSYQENKGATDCNTCGEGTTTETDGATSINDCLIVCAAGQYRSSPNECSVCDVGQYQPNPSSESCFNCSEGYITLGNASTSEMDCLRNCPAGQFRESSQRESCSPCPVGQYQPASGLTKCIQCEEGFTTLDKGSNSSDDCLPVCPPGRYLNVSSRSCSSCDLGTYKDSAGVQEDCTPCPPDTTTAASGANSSSQCDIDDCRAGYYRAESGRGCQMCGRGKYQPIKSQSSCIPCGDGFTTRLSVLDATSVGQCIVDCPEGEERDLQNTSLCRKCPNGQYRKKKLSDSCTFCPVGQTTTREGATSCVPYSPDVTKAPRKVLLKVQIRFILKSCSGLHFDVLRQRIRDRIKLRINVQVLQFPGLCSLGCANVKIKITLPCGGGLRKKRQATTNVTIDTIVELENVASQLADRNNTILRSTESLLEEVLGDESLIDEPLKNFGVDYDQITEISAAPKDCVDGAILDDTDNCVWCVKGTQYLTSPTRCEACPVSQYQDSTGKTACQQCPGKLSTRRNGSSSLQECISVCILKPDYCQHEGICRNSSVDELSCLCTEKYSGDRCEMRLAVESDLPAIIIGVCVGIFCVLVAILVIGWCCYRRRPDKQDKDNWSRITPPIDYIDYQTPALTPRSHLQMHKHIQFPNSSYSTSGVHDFYQSEWE